MFQFMFQVRAEMTRFSCFFLYNRIKVVAFFVIDIVIFGGNMAQDNPLIYKQKGDRCRPPFLLSC